MKWATTASLDELVQAFFCYPVMEVGMQPKLLKLTKFLTLQPCQADDFFTDRKAKGSLTESEQMAVMAYGHHRPDAQAPWRCMNGRLNAAPSYLDLCPPYIIMRAGL